MYIHVYLYIYIYIYIYIGRRVDHPRRLRPGAGGASVRAHGSTNSSRPNDE